MRNFICTLFVAIALCLPNTALAASQCTSNAVAQAKKLLSFHSNGDDRIEIMPEVKELPSISNPAHKKQKFQVLEVWGYIYKGSYRMRLIYYPNGNDCLLMGQEILEISKI